MKITFNFVNIYEKTLHVKLYYWVFCALVKTELKLKTSFFRNLQLVRFQCLGVSLTVFCAQNKNCFRKKNWKKMKFWIWMCCRDEEIPTGTICFWVLELNFVFRFSRSASIWRQRKGRFKENQDIPSFKFSFEKKRIKNDVKKTRENVFKTPNYIFVFGKKNFTHTFSVQLWGWKEALHNLQIKSADVFMSEERKKELKSPFKNSH